MGDIFAWIKAHRALDRIFSIGKGGFEVKRAYHEAEKAAAEARMISRQEKLANLELEMYKLDGRVKKEYGFSVSIQDPNVYITELNAEPDLVTLVLMKRGNDLALRAQTPDRWKSRW